MSHSKQKKLDELLNGAVELRPRPDFAEWRQKHPEAIDALRSLPTVIAKRRSTMIRITRYSTSAAAVLLFLAAVAWWMFFSQGARNAWAEVIDQLAQVRSATCNLHVYRGGFEEVSKTYLEGSRVRVEDPNGFHVTDFLEGKYLWAQNSTMTADIGDLEKGFGELIVLGSNPLNDLMQMKNAPAERLPDELIGDTLCQVYRVKDTAFMGYQVPWVKLWLDPDSKLPMQIHSVVGDRRAMTFNDFRWNEPFDEDLLELAVPEGYKLVESPGSEEVSKAPAPPLSGGAAPNEVGSTKDGPNAEAGRKIPVGEIAKTLDMLGQRIEANYKAINSWSGTFDVTERHRYTNPRNPQYEQISHADVEFFAEPGRDRIRINNRAVEPTRIVGNAAIKLACELPESRWVRTPEELLRFPVSDLRHTVKGFPRIVGLKPGKGFRVLYREPPKAAEQYVFAGYIDPRLFFGSGRTYWETCSMAAKGLRGELGSDTMEYEKSNTALQVRPKGVGTEYVLTNRFKPVGSNLIWKLVFSSEAGFNVVSMEFRRQEQVESASQYTFRKEKGVFIPCEVEFNRYYDRGTKDSSRLPTQHRVFVLKQTRVNEPIDPAVFEIQSLGLQDGDRMVDRIENRMLVFDGEQFVPADKFKLQPAAKAIQPAGDAKRDAGQRAESTNKMKQLALAMHNYHDTYKHLPPAYVASKDGKPLLSWRVLLLPYLERNDLYKQFHLDEPWDSPNNKKLIERMPTVYESPNSKVSGEWKTNYVTVRSEDTIFPGKKAISFREIRDGTSNTIMLVEANDDQAVIWTKPDDFEYDQQDPIRDLVGLWPDGFLAGLADGSVRFIWSSTNPTDLKAFFTRNGGEKVGMEALGP